MSDDGRWDDLDRRLSAVEELLRERPGRPPQETGDRFWVLAGLADDASALPGGAVVYAGRVRLPAGQEYAWQRTHAADDARGGADGDAAVASALGALAHPVRLRLVREVLTGTTTTAALAALPGLGTTGQLHHHLRQLTTTGWLRTTARGTYDVPADRVVPLHVVLAAVGS